MHLKEPAVRGLVDLSALRSARETADHVAQLASPLPSFIHKWSRKARLYDRSELALPSQLYLAGIPLHNDQMRIAVGGTRSPTVESFCLVTRIARRLGDAGCAIVSGGVPGIDLAAHLGALDSMTGKTYAVLANPVDGGLAGHEWSNRALENEIIRRGGFISEYETYADFGTPENGERLLQRDRIITGVSDVFVAFECNMDSATVDTAYRALAQGKMVIAVAPRRPSLRRGVEALSRDDRVAALNEGELDDETIVSRILAAATRRSAKSAAAGAG